MIYKYCLVVSKVFPYTLNETYNAIHHWYGPNTTKRDALGYEPPEVSILRACRSIYQEAEPILYQNNTFVLPIGRLTAQFFEVSLNTDTRRAWVTSVQIGLEPQDMTLKHREKVLDERIFIARQDLLYPSAWDLRDFADKLHDAYTAHLRTVLWPQKVAPLLMFLRLEKLVIDTEHCRCIQGCCTMIFQAQSVLYSAFRNGFIHGTPEDLGFRGLA